MEQVQKWAIFPFEELVNCKSIRISVYLDEYSNVPACCALEYQILNRIKSGMPYLKELTAYGNHVEDSEILRIFQDSKLEQIYLDNVPNCISKLNDMSDLTSLWIDNIIGLSAIDVVFPRISKLRIDDFGSTRITEAEAKEFFRGLDRMFPNLKEYMGDDIDNIPLIDVLEMIPRSLDTLQFSLFEYYEPFTPCNAFHDTIVFNLVCPYEVEENSTHSIVDYLQRCSNNWILSFGLPTFLIITNIPNIKNIMRYSYALNAGDRHSLDQINPCLFNSKMSKKIQVHASRPLYLNQEDSKDLNILANYGFDVIKYLSTDTNFDLAAWVGGVLDENFDSGTGKLSNL